MLKSNQRHILYFDLAMAPYPSDAPPIPMDEIMPDLEARCAQGKCVQIIDDNRRVVRLSATKRVVDSKGQPAVAMLFCLGDRDKADPGFTDFNTGAVRIPEKGENEAGGLSVHALITLSPTQPKGHLYQMLYEDVMGFGRSLIQNFLRAEFKTICEDRAFNFLRENKREIKTRPLVEISGHASDKLKNSLNEGKLLYIELVDYVTEDFGFDEQHIIKTAKRDLTLSISKALPQGEGLKFVEKVKVWAKAKGYANMRVRWRDPALTKPQSAKVDVAREDAGEALFVKSSQISLRLSLPDISAQLSEELIGKMAELLT